jgi:hypothetical protein
MILREPGRSADLAGPDAEPGGQRRRAAPRRSRQDLPLRARGDRRARTVDGNPGSPDQLAPPQPATNDRKPPSTLRRVRRGAALASQCDQSRRAGAIS